MKKIALMIVMFALSACARPETGGHSDEVLPADYKVYLDQHRIAAGAVERIAALDTSAAAIAVLVAAPAAPKDSVQPFGQLQTLILSGCSSESRCAEAVAPAATVQPAASTKGWAPEPAKPAPEKKVNPRSDEEPERK